LNRAAASAGVARATPRCLSVLVLIAFLVLSQASLLTHQADIDAHQGSAACHVCLHAHGFDHGVTSAALSIVFSSLGGIFTCTDILSLPLASTAAYQSRAPPCSSSV